MKTFAHCIATLLQRQFPPSHLSDISLLSIRSLLLIQEQEIQADVDSRSPHGRHSSSRSFPWSRSLPWCHAGTQPRALPRLLSQYDGPQPWPSLLWTLPARALWIWPGQHAPSAQSKKYKPNPTSHWDTPPLRPTESVSSYFFKSISHNSVLLCILRS